MSKNLKAFSLIELSIVILIIGILIAGVTQSSRLITQFRLSTARTLTQSSPAVSMRNLALWYETTSDKSFDDAEQEDGLAVTNFYDINPTVINKVNASASSTLRPTYKTNCINGLPCLSFDGTDDCLDTTSVGTSSTTLSYFAVLLPTTISTVSLSGIIMTTGTWLAASGSVHFQIMTGASQDKLQYGPADGSTGVTSAVLSKTSPQIVSLVDNGTTANFFRNGAADGTITTSGVRTLDLVTLGCLRTVSRSRFFTGYLAEILIFDRGLKAEERRAIEAYLGKKWGIKVI